MGCACDQERTREDLGPKESLARVIEISDKVSTRKPRHHKQQTDLDAKSFVTEVIRTLSTPLSGDYRIVSTVKEDEFSRLVKAEYLSTKQPCMLKIIPKLAGRDLLLQRTRLASEADRTSRLDHPFILRTYEIFQDKHNFYAALEPFVVNIADCLSEPWTREEQFLAKVMYQVFRALNYCHQQGIVHGHLTLERIMLTERPSRDSVKVRLVGFSDFDSTPDSIGSEDTECRSPEITSGYNEKTDMWSCGMILTKLLNDRTPVRSLKSSPQRRKTCLVFSPTEFRERSEELSALIEALLHESPQGRPSAAQCLTHPWLQKYIRPSLVKAGTINSCLSNLRAMKTRNPLHEGVLKFILARSFQSKDFDTFLEAFCLLDSDHDGVFSEDEVRKNFNRMMLEPDALKATRRVMEIVEHNCSPVVSYSEFLVACMGEKKLLSDLYLREAFRCFDRGHCGRVSLQELRTYFLKKPSEQKERQWRQLFLHCEGVTELDYCQFISLLTHS